jgi:hypothetical protein
MIHYSHTFCKRGMLLCMLLLTSHLGLSQYDFSKVNLDQVNVDSVQAQIQQLYLTTGIDSLNSLIAYKNQIRGDHRKNVSFDIGYSSAMSSLDNLNRGLAALGLPPISQDFAGVPWGFSVRGKRMSFSYHFAPSIKNTVSNVDYTVDAERIWVGLVFGYDLLNVPRIHLYPQVSLDFQEFEITARRNAASTDITDINGLILNPAGSTAAKAAFTLSYSGEIDVNLLAGEGSGIILGFRYGASIPLSEGRYSIDDESSSFDTPGDKIWNSFYSIVLKFYFTRE